MHGIEKKKAIGIIHKIYLSHLKNSYKHLASTKTKSEVRGGGKKPWRQKGTGNARAGSTRSPLWVGGGVIFGPRPHLVYKKINRKERFLALISALYLKKEQIYPLHEDFFASFTTIKTKKVANLLTEYKIPEKKKVLFILCQPNRKFWLSTRNLKNINITTAHCIHIEQIINADYIIMSNTSFHLTDIIYGR
jgi:large subunit ribosomal protein L4